MTRKPLRIGTRGSRLALWQAEHVAERIGRLPGAPAVEVVKIRTEGDRIVDVPLSAVSGQAFFTKEIEQALLDGRVDLAVHSMKDLATCIPEGLTVAAVPEREDPRDVLLSRDGAGLRELAAGARVGTSSLRRRALVLRLRPDLELAELRGNVPTRLEKLREGRYDAIVLAAAGVKRLGLEEHIAEFLPPEHFAPAVSQGALAIETRSGDQTTQRWLRSLDHAATRSATMAERSLLHRLEGGCQVPVGALATVDQEILRLAAVVCSLDGARAVEGSLEGVAQRAEELGLALAEKLLAQGGDAILAEIRDPRGEMS
ncbi:MAG: hydroxymethylbilane synthase [bacterium]|nr:hydroxymethylbilane synthase [bacterium]